MCLILFCSSSVQKSRFVKNQLVFVGPTDGSTHLLRLKLIRTHTHAQTQTQTHRHTRTHCVFIKVVSTFNKQFPPSFLSDKPECSNHPLDYCRYIDVENDCPVKCGKARLWERRCPYTPGMPLPPPSVYTGASSSHLTDLGIFLLVGLILVSKI